MNDPSVEVLNRAFAADREAVRAVFDARVRCNRALADDPHIQVRDEAGDGQAFTVGVIGLLNGLRGAAGLPLVAETRASEPGPDGVHELLGFCWYRPPDPGGGEVTS
jgi:hypothetical protein